MSYRKYDGFKFEVGQFVCSAALRIIGKRDLSYTYQVIERIYQECPGGVQLHYRCRPHHIFNDGKGFVELNEIELMSLDELDEIDSAKRTPPRPDTENQQPNIKQV